MSVLAEPISPELVLVSPPEVARVARALLDDRPLRQARAPRRVELRAVELVAVYAFCLLLTVGPLLFIVLATPDRGA